MPWSRPRNINHHLVKGTSQFSARPQNLALAEPVVASGSSKTLVSISVSPSPAVVYLATPNPRTLTSISDSPSPAVAFLI